MAEVDVFVWYDSDGNITAIGTPHPDRLASVHPIAAKANVVSPKYTNYINITVVCWKVLVAVQMAGKQGVSIAHRFGVYRLAEGTRNS